MIVRIWTAEALADNAEDYRVHFTDTLVPRLRAIDGFVSAAMLERVMGEVLEFVVITRWDTMDAIHAFAGHQLERAVVGPEIRHVLERFDETVKHYVQVAEVRA